MCYIDQCHLGLLILHRFHCSFWRVVLYQRYFKHIKISCLLHTTFNVPLYEKSGKLYVPYARKEGAFVDSDRR